MLIGFLYQLGNAPDYTFQGVEMRANINVYMSQVKKVLIDESKIVCRWVIKKVK